MKVEIKSYNEPVLIKSSNHFKSKKLIFNRSKSIRFQTKYFTLTAIVVSVPGWYILLTIPHVPEPISSTNSKSSIVKGNV